MSNLSSAIIEARKRHEAEIAERLERRKQRQRAELERLNRVAADAVPAPVAASPSAPTVPETEPEANAAPTLVPPPSPTAALEAPHATVADAPVEREVAPVVAAPPAPAIARAEVEPPEPVGSNPAPRPRAERLVAEESFDAPARLDEVETPPDARYLKLRNEIIDRVKPYLTGNQFAVYMEIYRQTVGRGRASAWFRTREIQTACNIGSDNTVRDAYPVLEQKKLIKLDPNRRAGSPKGLFITVLSVERALERLERQPVPAASLLAVEPASSAPAQPSPLDPALVDRLTRDYGVTPTMVPQIVESLDDDDRALLPYLFDRLDASIASGTVHNPAGLLRVWIASFEAWRPELEAERDAARARARVAAERLDRDALTVEWFRETEAEAERRLAALEPDARAEIERRGRESLLASSPFVRTWSEEQWARQLEIYAKSELRNDLPGFDDWLATRSAS